MYVLTKRCSGQMLSCCDTSYPPRHFDVDVDSIEHGARDAFLVVRDGLKGAGAFLVAMGIFTGAGIHCC